MRWSGGSTMSRPTRRRTAPRRPANGGPRPRVRRETRVARRPSLGRRSGDRDLDDTFRERWNDPTPLADRRTPWRALISRFAEQPDRRDRLGPQPADPAPVGSHAIQVLRTYPLKRPPYPFAPRGERSIMRAYRRAFSRARCLIYVEDQYLWSREVAQLFAGALRRSPDLRVMVIVPRVPDRNGPISGPRTGSLSWSSSDRLQAAGGDRFAIYDLEGEAGTPIYVHAKTVVVDDVWAAVGSDNLNRRSWTHLLGVLDRRPRRRSRSSRTHGPGRARRRREGSSPRPPDNVAGRAPRDRTERRARRPGQSVRSGPRVRLRA